MKQRPIAQGATSNNELWDLRSSGEICAWLGKHARMFAERSIVSQSWGKKCPKPRSPSIAADAGAIVCGKKHATMNRLRIGLVHWNCLRPNCMHILCLGHVCFTVTLFPLTSRVEKRYGQNIFEQNFVERTFGIVGPARRRVQRV